MDNRDQAFNQYMPWYIAKNNKQIVALSFLVWALLLGGFSLLGRELFSPPQMNNLEFCVLVSSIFILLLAHLTVDLAVVDYFHSQLTGVDQTLISALGSAFRRLPALVKWSIYGLTVGLRLKRESPPRVFVLQIMVAEQIGPFPAMQRSTQLVSDRWGDDRQLANKLSNVPISSSFAVTYIAAILLGFFVAATGFEYSGFVMVGVVALLVIPLPAAAAIQSTWSHYLTSVLYVYTTKNTVADGFSGTWLQQAFEPRLVRVNDMKP